MIAVVADVHGREDRFKLEDSYLLQRLERLPDYVIVAGDFGLPWYLNDVDEELKKWYEQKPYEIIVVPGNHENYSAITRLPKIARHNALLRKYGTNIFFVDRNQVLNLEGKTFYCFGGAVSVDAHVRIPYVSWWPEEEATTADFLAMKKVLKNVKEVDYIIAHTAPSSVIERLFKNAVKSCTDTTARILDYLVEQVAFKAFLFGHFHQDMQWGLYRCLNLDVVQI